MENSGSSNLQQLCSKFETSITHGIPGTEEDLARRRQTHGSNSLQNATNSNYIARPFTAHFWEAFFDKKIILLRVAVYMNLPLIILSLFLSLILFYSTSGYDDEEEENHFVWVALSSLVVICSPLLLTSLITAKTNCAQDKDYEEFRNTNSPSACTARVIRNGELRVVTRADLVVGDICELQPGDFIPADVVLVESSEPPGLKCDESTMDDNAKIVQKFVFGNGNDGDSKLFFGTIVCKNSCHGKMIVERVGATATAAGPSETATVTTLRRQCVLSQKLIRFSYIFLKIAVLIGSLLVASMILRFSVERYMIEKQDWSSYHVRRFLRFVAIGYDVVVMAIPLAIPFSVAIAQHVGIKRLKTVGFLARNSAHSDTFGNADVICTSKSIAKTISRELMKIGLATVSTFDPNAANSEQNVAKVQDLAQQGQVVAVIAQGRQSRAALPSSDVGILITHKTQNHGGGGQLLGADLIVATETTGEKDICTTLCQGIAICRTTRENICKFIQFHSAVILVVTLSHSLAIVFFYNVGLFGWQQIWISLTSTLFGVMFALDPPQSLPPDNKGTPQNSPRANRGEAESLVSRLMLKNILGHTTYQLIAMLAVTYCTTEDDESEEKSTEAFNSVYMMILFNAICSRNIYGQLNVFQGIWLNKAFCCTWLLCLVLQVTIVEWATTNSLDLKWWCISLAVGLGSILLSFLLTLIPPKGSPSKHTTPTPLLNTDV